MTFGLYIDIVDQLALIQVTGLTRDHGRTHKRAV